MPKRYTYVVTCTKETPIKWKMELESLGEAVPSKVVRFPNLSAPLTESPHSESVRNPMDYFKRLVKGIPDMLGGYNTNTFKQIQNQMSRLEVGDSCYVNISYTDNGRQISPYNYKIELLDAAPESHTAHIPSAALPSAASSAISPPPPEVELALNPSVREARAADLADRMSMIHNEIRNLQADVNWIKDWLAEHSRTPQNAPETERAKVRKGQMVKSTKNPVRSDTLRGQNQGSDEILLTREERAIIQHIMNPGVIAQSELLEKCKFPNPTEVIDSLMAKMAEANSPWIAIRRRRSGELVYTWNAPQRSV
jgi:hypothetical protein